MLSATRGLGDGAHEWVAELPVAVTVCDLRGVILALNTAAARVFAAQGGAALVGRNLLDCHPEPARSKLAALLDAPHPNSYTIEKAGRRKLIHQTPWYREGRVAGLVELSLPLPAELPHFVRG